MSLVVSVVGAMVVMVLINLVALRGSSEMDMLTLQTVRDRLQQCDSLETAQMSRPVVSGAGNTVECPACPTCQHLDAESEVMAQGRLMAEMKQADCASVKNVHAAAQKQSEEQHKQLDMMSVEATALRRQLKQRDDELEAKSPRPAQEPRVAPEPGQAELDRWAAVLPAETPLRKSGTFFTTQNWKTLDSLLVLVATGSINHKSRAALHLESWIKLMPNASRQVMFVSDRVDAALAPVPVTALTPEESWRSGFRAAQWRFIRALATVGDRDFGGMAPKWVYLMDDDAFMHVPNMAHMLPKLKDTEAKYYGDLCGSIGGVYFPCGGAGLLFSFRNLRKAWRQLKTCHLAKDGQMGQYDVAISHCLDAANLKLEVRAEFCSQPPAYYVPNKGKPGTGMADFLRQISFHYVTLLIPSFYQKVINEIPLWPPDA